MADLLDALLDAIADAVYVVGPAGEIRFINPAGLALLGYDDAGELLGRDSHATIHHSHPDGTPYPADECPLLAPRTTGEVVRVERDWFVRRDGAMVPVGYASAPVSGEDGRGAVVVFRDVSERIAAERALAEAAAADARAQEIAASRARLAAAADAERRRLVRDLHDGAQQRLVGVLMRVDEARRRPEALDDAAAEAQRAIDELRALARGIHPAILSARGIGAALEDLTASAAVPVALDVVEQRFAPEVEAAAYFVVAEALANVAKHAGASEAFVRVGIEQGDAADLGGDVAPPVGLLGVQVRDDGRGGADATRGSGLRGLADRVAALGGTLTVDSRPGAGTTLRARLPLTD